MTDNTQDIQQETPEYVAVSGQSIEGGKPAQMQDIIDALRTVADPEIMINIYDMGMIYKISPLDNADVYIEMSLTSPTCPVAGILPQQAADAVASLPSVGKVEVKVVWEPAWTIDMLSPEVKEMLEMI